MYKNLEVFSDGKKSGEGLQGIMNPKNSFQKFFRVMGTYLLWLSLPGFFMSNCTNYKVKEIPPGDVLEKELRAPSEIFKEEGGKEGADEGKKSGKKK